MSDHRPLTPGEAGAVRAVLARYALPPGRISAVRDMRGFVNVTYLVTAGRRKFVLRESNPATPLAHLKLEIEVLHHLATRGFRITPRIIPARNGSRIVMRGGRRYTLQNFLPGRPKASWNDLSAFDLGRLRSFFGASARFERAMQTFRSSSRAGLPDIARIMARAGATYGRASRGIPPSEGRSLLAAHDREIRTFIADTKKELDALGYGALPKQIVHFDLHPGNVHFGAGDRVTGLFDFDWIRWDCRMSDLAATLCQSCYWYGGKRAGRYRADRIKEGLSTYRRAYGRSEYDPATERRLIKAALKGYLVFQLLWCLDWYKDHCRDEGSGEVVRQFVNAVTLNDYEKLFA